MRIVNLLREFRIDKKGSKSLLFPNKLLIMKNLCSISTNPVRFCAFCFNFQQMEKIFKKMFDDNK